MIIRIHLELSEDKDKVFLFGNSYKNWDCQFAEFCRIYNPIKVVSVETSKDEWIGWGGLKWCPATDFQNQLNREKCQYGEPDNPKPRQYSSMKFESNQRTYNKVKKMVNDRILAVKRYQEKLANEAKPDYAGLNESKFIIKNENMGSPYWLLEPDGESDMPRTVIETSAYQFKSREMAEKVVKQTVDENYYRFKGDYSKFEIIKIQK